MITVFLLTFWLTCSWHAYGYAYGWSYWVTDGDREKAHDFGLFCAFLGPLSLLSNNDRWRMDNDLVYGPWLADKIKRYKSRDRIKKLRECGWDV